MTSPEMLERFTELLVAGDRRGALGIAEKRLDEGGVAEVLEGLVQPALERVGSLWQANKLLVAEEHLATATAEAVVALLYGRFPWPKAGPKAMLCSVEGERHGFGTRIVGDLLALDGWDAQVLGADTPLPSLVKLVAARQPLFVGLSATLQARLPAVRSTANAVRSALPSVRIIGGGRAFVGLHDAAQLAQVDAVFQRGREAVEFVRQWASWETTMSSKH
jgi:MerR family transcriptional regulator, light-induced transcriptional regulator